MRYLKKKLLRINIIVPQNSTFYRQDKSFEQYQKKIIFVIIEGKKKSNK